MPANVVLKISWAVVAYNLICKGENGLFVFNDLKECFWERNLKDEFEIIENKK